MCSDCPPGIEISLWTKKGVEFLVHCFLYIQVDGGGVQWVFTRIAVVHLQNEDLSFFHSDTVPLG